MTVSKEKDGIPGGDGNPSWSEYKRAAFFCMRTRSSGRIQIFVWPRLAAELSGAAKAAIGNKKRGWLSRSDGVEKLIHCLRDETKSAFCVRHREDYARTCKALTRVMREQNQLGLHPKHAWRSGRRSSQSTIEPNTDRPEARSSQTGGVQ